MPRLQPGCPICGSSVKNWRTSSHQGSQMHQQALIQQGGGESGQYLQEVGGYDYEEQEPMPYMPKNKNTWKKTAQRPQKPVYQRPQKQVYQRPQFQDEDEAEYSSSGSDGYEDA